MNKSEFQKFDFAQLKLIRHELEESFKDELFTLGNHHYSKYLYRNEDTEEFEKNITQTVARLDDIIKNIAELEIQLSDFEVKMDDYTIPVGAMLN